MSTEQKTREQIAVLRGELAGSDNVIAKAYLQGHIDRAIISLEKFHKLEQRIKYLELQHERI